MRQPIEITHQTAGPVLSSICRFSAIDWMYPEQVGYISMHAARIIAISGARPHKRWIICTNNKRAIFVASASAIRCILRAIEHASLRAYAFGRKHPARHHRQMWSRVHVDADTLFDNSPLLPSFNRCQIVCVDLPIFSHFRCTKNA